jgi:hypothetical protein
MGLVEVFHGTDEGMGEIEAASRYSMPRILAGRLLVVGLISAPVCLIWGVLTSLKCNIPAIGWAITPYCLSAAAGMIFATLLKGRANTLQIAATLAVVNAFAAIAVGRAMHGPAAPLFQWGMLIGSLAAAAISVGYMLRHISGIEERSRELWN